LASKISDSTGQVARLVAEGELVAIGGMHMHNNPMALIREVVRKEVPVKQLLTSPSGSMGADVLIGAGLVEEVLTSYIGFEHLGLAPCFRRAVESGRLRVRDLSEGALTHGLYAGASGIPFIPLPRGEELADVWRANTDDFRQGTDPFSSESVLAVRALRPDVALIHAKAADEAGNAMFVGAYFTDRLMAMAAKRVVIQVEKIASANEVASRPAGTTLPGFLVDMVVVVPGGCLPTSSMGTYDYDETALREYLKLAKTPDGFQQYVYDHFPAQCMVEPCFV
jgi:glutaconate CoA-transferase subunit A